jgi:hypothetical protein
MPAPATIQSRKKARRLFVGLAGSALSRIIRQNLTAEESVTAKKNRLPKMDPTARPEPIDVRMSSKDRDPAFSDTRSADKKKSLKQIVAEIAETVKRRSSGLYDPVKDNEDAQVHFQTYAFDPKLSRGTDPIAYIGDRRDDNKSENDITFSAASQNFPNGGYSVQTLRGAEDPKPRSRIPWWIKNPTTFHEFRTNLTACKNDTGIDFAILRCYYLLSASDEEIFNSFKGFLKAEHGLNRKRWTSSVNALKNRRVNLIKLGFEVFGEDHLQEGPEHLEHLALWKSIREAPGIKQPSKNPAWNRVTRS